jgi:hypothetical protein
VSDPSVVVQRAPDGWTHIGGPGMRKAQHFVGVHWRPQTRVVAFGSQR